MLPATVFLTVLTLAPPSSSLAQSPPDAITVQEVLNEIQRGLSGAQQELVAGKIPPLDSVVLNLLTEYNAKGGPKFRILIFSFGKTWEKQRSNQLVLTLKPPKPEVEQPLGGTAGISTQLVAAIVAAAQGVKEAESGKPPLLLDSLKAEFSFVVKEVTSGGVKFEIVPVSAELSGDLSKKAVHTVTVTFAKPKGSSQ